MTILTSKVDMKKGLSSYLPLEQPVSTSVLLAILNLIGSYDLKFDRTPVAFLVLPPPNVFMFCLIHGR